MPLVTIGLPVYNGENYLDVTLEALLAQTHRDIEVVIGDNTSTDRTEEICRQHAARDERIRYHRHERNLGAAPNYNFTVDQARGEYFMWTAHDDLRGERFVEEALTMFGEFPFASSVISPVSVIDADGDVIDRRRTSPALLSDDTAARLRAIVIDRHPAAVIFGLMKTDVLNSTNRHGNYPGGDRVLGVELALRGPFVEIPSEQFFMRNHPGRYVKMPRGTAKSLWWDATRAGTIDAPAWRRWKAYWEAIRTSDLPPHEKRRCRRALARAAFDNRVAIPREIGHDVLVATGERLSRMLRGGADAEPGN